MQYETFTYLNYLNYWLTTVSVQANWHYFLYLQFLSPIQHDRQKPPSKHDVVQLYFARICLLRDGTQRRILSTKWNLLSPWYSIILSSSLNIQFFSRFSLIRPINCLLELLTIHVSNSLINVLVISYTIQTCVQSLGIIFGYWIPLEAL